MNERLNELPVSEVATETLVNDNGGLSGSQEGDENDHLSTHQNFNLINFNEKVPPMGLGGSFHSIELHST